MIIKRIMLIIIIANIGLMQAQYTAIPDPAFEQELINQGIDSQGTLDGQVLTSDIDSITNLIIFNTNINYMSGIEGFVALTNLTVENNERLTHLNLDYNNALTHLSCNDNLSLQLNVENLTNLEYLSCDNIPIYNFELGNKPHLTYFSCNFNSLTTIDITQCPNLEELFCFHSGLTSLDVSQNPKLRVINASENSISEIDVSSNIDLATLDIWSNNLTTINLNQNITLERLYCYNNNLTSLYIQNNANGLITGFSTVNNPNLECIFVDDASYSTTNWLNIDSNSHFVETQLDCDNLAINETTINDISIYPNPTTDSITIYEETDINIEDNEIYDTLGNLIIKTKNKTINLSSLEKGLYILKVELKSGKQLTTKIIKK